MQTIVPHASLLASDCNTFFFVFTISLHPILITPSCTFTWQNAKKKTQESNRRKAKIDTTAEVSTTASVIESTAAFQDTVTAAAAAA
jgi:hypothetical protein